MHFIYVLQSKKDKNLYIGCTKDVVERIKLHNAGKVRSTKHRRPLALLYMEEYSEKHVAFQRERFYKTPKGKKEIKSKIDNCRVI